MIQYARYVDLAQNPSIKPIEIAVYEPDEKPGYLRYVGNRTIQQIFDELEERLKAENCYPDEYFDISFTNKERSAEQEFPLYRWIACFPVPGSNEGHYIHVEVISPEGEREIIFLGKTFQGFEFAAKVAMACAKHLGA
jgi:hypothetical protein